MKKPLPYRGEEAFSITSTLSSLLGMASRSLDINNTQTTVSAAGMSAHKNVSAIDEARASVKRSSTGAGMYARASGDKIARGS